MNLNKRKQQMWNKLQVAETVLGAVSGKFKELSVSSAICGGLPRDCLLAELGIDMKGSGDVDVCIWSATGDQIDEADIKRAIYNVYEGHDDFVWEGNFAPSIENHVDDRIIDVIQFKVFGQSFDFIIFKPDFTCVDSILTSFNTPLNMVKYENGNISHKHLTLENMSDYRHTGHFDHNRRMKIAEMDKAIREHSSAVPELYAECLEPFGLIIHALVIGDGIEISYHKEDGIHVQTERMLMTVDEYSQLLQGADIEETVCHLPVDQRTILHKLTK